MIIVPDVTEIRKLSVSRCPFSLGAYDVSMMSSERQKLVFLLFTQNQVTETFVNDSFS